MDIDRKRQEQLFLTAYVLWMVSSVIRITTWREIGDINTICKFVEKIAYLLLVIRYFLKKRYTLKDFIGIFLILFSCVLADHSVYNSQIIPTAIFACSAWDVDYRKILKYTLLLQTFIMALTVGASQTGIIEDIIWNDSGRLRHSLGYTYCGYPAHLLFFMTLMWFCIRKKANIADAVVCVMLNYAMYAATDSRTDFALAILAVIGFYIWGREFRLRLLKSLRDFGTKYAFLLAALFSFVIQMFYNSQAQWMQRLDVILNGRLHFGHDAIKEYGFSIFGQSIRWFGQGSLKADSTRIYNYVDNSFLKETLTYGLVFFVILAVGYYLAGRVIAEKKRYILGWAVLMSLAYAVINAHLCVLTFNVFILVLGEPLKDSKKEIPGEEGVLYLPHISLNAKRRCVLRVLSFAAILFGITWLQCQGTAYIIKHHTMYMWILCGVLLLLILLCTEKIQQRNVPHGWLMHLTGFFLVLAMASDFFVAKKFQYSGFALLCFGGMFCHAWYNMDQPGKLIDEFKYAYKIWFIVSIIYCVAMRPAMPGIRYTGMFPTAEGFGAAMLLAMVVFLSDLKWKGRAAANVIGALAALYLVWTVQDCILFLLSAVIIFIYLIYQAGRCNYNPDGDKTGLQALAAVIGGILLVLLLRWTLYHLTPALGEGIVYETDKYETIQESLRSTFLHGGWIETVRTKLWLAKEYFMKMNLKGHSYVAKIAGKKRWAQNSVVMNMYRYGVLAGIAYLGMLLVYLCAAVRNSWENRDFFPVGIAAASIMICMAYAVEMPFAQIVWAVFYFGLAWMIVSENGEKQHEIFKYKHR